MGRGKHVRIQRLLNFRQAIEGVPRLSVLYSEGDVFRDEPGGSILIKRLRGALFESQEVTEAHGLELCREWIDKIEKT